MEILDEIKKIADERGLDGEDREDFIELRMKRAGFRRGPGEWVEESDDDEGDKDDDNEPVTRGDIRRMERERRAKQREKATPPPKVEKDDKDKKPLKKSDPWWR